MPLQLKASLINEFPPPRISILLLSELKIFFDCVCVLRNERCMKDEDFYSTMSASSGLFEMQHETSSPIFAG